MDHVRNPMYAAEPYEEASGAVAEGNCNCF